MFFDYLIDMADVLCYYLYDFKLNFMGGD